MQTHARRQERTYTHRHTDTDTDTCTHAHMHARTHLSLLPKELLDGVHAYHSDSVARHYLVCEVTITVELNVAGQLAVGHRVRALLEFEHLEVHTLALVGHNEVGVHRALGSAGLVPVRGGAGVKRCPCSSKVL